MACILTLLAVMALAITYVTDSFIQAGDHEAQMKCLRANDQWVFNEQKETWGCRK